MRAAIAISVAVSLLPMSQARAGGMTSDGLQSLLDTKFTELDTDGDGAADTFRKFDGRGELIEMVQHFGPRNARTRVEFRRERSPSLLSWKEFLNDKLIRQVEEKLGTDDILIERIAYDSSKQNGHLDHLTRESIQGGSLVANHYSLETGGKWKATGTTRKPLKTSADQSFIERFPACGSEAAKVSGLPCGSTGAKPTEPIPYADLNADYYANVECRDRQDLLSLESGFRVDLSSCATPAAVETLRSESMKARSKMLSCLNDLNPNYARKVASTISERHPILTCANPANTHRPRGSVICPATMDPTTRAQCLSEIKLADSDAYVLEAHPNKIFLNQSDPTQSLGQQYGDLTGTVIFHESLHLAGHDGCADHNPLSRGDDVYGCMLLCSGNSQAANAALSAESCRACVRGYSKGEKPRSAAAGGNPNASESLLSDCDRFPTQQALKLKDDLRRFDQCAKALGTTDESALCAGYTDTDQYSECKAAGKSSLNCITERKASIKKEIPDHLPPNLRTASGFTHSVKNGRIVVTPK